MHLVMQAFTVRFFLNNELFLLLHFNTPKTFKDCHDCPVVFKMKNVQFTLYKVPLLEKSDHDGVLWKLLLYLDIFIVLSFFCLYYLIIVISLKSVNLVTRRKIR